MVLPLLLLASVAVADGIEVLQVGDTHTAEVKSFVLPESYYDSCLEKAQLLEDTQAELYKLQDQAGPALEEAQDALIVAQSELQKCGQQVGVLRTDAAVLREENRQLKSKQILLGGGFVTVAIIAGLEAWALSQK